MARLFSPQRMDAEDDIPKWESAKKSLVSLSQKTTNVVSFVPITTVGSSNSILQLEEAENFPRNFPYNK